MKEVPEPSPKMRGVRESARIAGISRAKLYREMAKLDVRKCGRRTLITASSLDAYLAALPRKN